ncbi:hypothetical protein [Oceanobacillus kimchii]|uniref:hypothetical protein n=1 Tax=Oceanobacillus kimchii TaxID=746691 RepID=UPI001FCB9B8F|nr:hypothetical protein [Oceanobacillus kimchii]
MPREKFAEFITSLQNRTNKLDPYQDYILMWLKEYPDVTSAQIHDWLQDGNTVRNYVNDLRDKYHIAKVTVGRMYGTV